MERRYQERAMRTETNRQMRYIRDGVLYYFDDGSDYF